MAESILELSNFQNHAPNLVDHSRECLPLETRVPCHRIPYVLGEYTLGNSHTLSRTHYDARCWLLDAHLLRTTTTLVRVGTIAPSLSVGAAHSLVGVPRTTCSSRSASLAERNPWPPQPAALYTQRP